MSFRVVTTVFETWLNTANPDSDKELKRLGADPALSIYWGRMFIQFIKSVFFRYAH